MGYPDFPIPEQERSYLCHEEILSFLDQYANHFDLKEHIKFLHCVIRVRPIGDDRWEVIVRDLPNNEYKTLEFDAVMVSNGHFHAPNLPNFPGKKLFKGKQIHSHDYRNAESFKGKENLI